MTTPPDNRKRRNKNRLWIWAVLVVLLLMFIWGNSLLSVAKSTTESRWVLELVRPFLERFVGVGNVTDRLVRKLAHYVEFAALGFALYWLALVRIVPRRMSDTSGGSGTVDVLKASGNSDAVASPGQSNDSKAVAVSGKTGGSGVFRAALVASGCAFLAAFFDETIQLFVGRGALITDVWLDVAGAFAGILLAGLLSLVLRGPRAR